ncbi:MAG: Molybdopterin molybdenumtransferase [Firmicutes bacterium ADurb.Bin373]|nr:molybdopterin molybdotransferase MoeA [Bacillota bacterium]OQA08718.1 MAG: Molybdopterin molybdenumtransferase [Firmicutes bacterium ADurb.Bin373]
MAELFKVLTLAEARAAIMSHLPAEKTGIKVPILESLGCRLTADVRAVDNVPAFNRSTVDGYAVKAKDTYGASEGIPSYLDVSGEALIGQVPAGRVDTGQTWYIATGAMIPAGADAVVMVEYTEELDSRTIGINRPVAPGENVIRRGEDITAGDIALPASHRIRPQDLGLLSSIGVTEVEVTRITRVGIISTGDELINPLEKPSPGEIRDINSYILYGAVLAAGGRPRLYGIVPDDYDKLRKTLARALDENDMVLISGGSSVGARDVTFKVIDTAGKPGVVFHGISVKPGKPTAGAVIGGKPLFGLPGHPASALVIFDVLVAPLLRDGAYPATEEESALEFPVKAIITRNLHSAAGRKDYFRVKVSSKGGQLFAEPVLGKSGLINTMIKANGLAHIPAGKEGVEAGEIVDVKLF